MAQPQVLQPDERTDPPQPRVLHGPGQLERMQPRVLGERREPGRIRCRDARGRGTRACRAWRGPRALRPVTEVSRSSTRCSPAECRSDRRPPSPNPRAVAREVGDGQLPEVQRAVVVERGAVEHDPAQLLEPLDLIEREVADPRAAKLELLEGLGAAPGSASRRARPSLPRAPPTRACGATGRACGRARCPCRGCAARAYAGGSCRSGPRRIGAGGDPNEGERLESGELRDPADRHAVQLEVDELEALQPSAEAAQSRSHPGGTARDPKRLELRCSLRRAAEDRGRRRRSLQSSAASCPTRSLSDSARSRVLVSVRSRAVSSLAWWTRTRVGSAGRRWRTTTEGRRPPAHSSARSRACPRRPWHDAIATSIARAEERGGTEQTRDADRHAGGTIDPARAPRRSRDPRDLPQIGADRESGFLGPKNAAGTRAGWPLSPAPSRPKPAFRA